MPHESFSRTSLRQYDGPKKSAFN